MKKSQAIQAINKNGILLVYPIPEKKEPASLWSVAYPRSKMKWEWDSDGDNRVADLWHIRAELSISKKVIYTKWYQGRATFLSRELFRALLKVFSSSQKPLSRDAKNILSLLEESSPQSTRQIKKGAELPGKLLESTYHRAMKELWERFAIVAFGEVEEGSFPSLAIGASKLLFEDLQLESLEMSEKKAREILQRYFPEASALRRFLDRQLKNHSLNPL